MTRDEMKFLLMLPLIMIGCIIGFTIGPIWYGVQIAYEAVESFTERMTVRGARKREADAQKPNP